MVVEKFWVLVMLWVVEEIVLILLDVVLVFVESEVCLLDNDEVLLWVDVLCVGSWVEIQEDVEYKLCCKLVVVIWFIGCYIFVNCIGMKVLEKICMGLVVEFCWQVVCLLDDVLLFDWVLELVIGNLWCFKGVQLFFEDLVDVGFFFFCG